MADHSHSHSHNQGHTNCASGCPHHDVVQSHGGTIVSEPRFIATSCHVCKRYPPDVTLKRCSGCRQVAYCDREHQVAHWPLHKDICKALKTIREATEKEHKIEDTSLPPELLKSLSEGPFTEEEWVRGRMDKANIVCRAMGRGLCLYESEMLHFPYACDHCHMMYPKAKLTECETCSHVSYCSKECQDQGKEHHDNWCSEHRLFAELERIFAEKGVPLPWIPASVCTEYTPLPATFDEYMTFREFPVGILQPSSMALMSILSTDSLSYPVSIVYALQKSGLGKDGLKQIQVAKELTIHLAGAMVQPEMVAIMKYEEILHLLPELRKLTVVMVGPELVLDGDESDDVRCDICKERGKELVFMYRRQLYHDFLEKEKSEPYVKADAVVAFNCGLHEYWGEKRDTWGLSLPAIIGNDEVPFIFTSFTWSEAMEDAKRLTEEQGAHMVVPPQRNPYFNRRPMRDWARDNGCDFFYANNYIAVARGKTQAPKENDAEK